MLRSFHKTSLLLMMMIVWRVKGENRKIIDLSQNMRNGIPDHPFLDIFNLTLTHKEQRDGYWYQEEFMSGSTHAGTHVDAPCHFNKGEKCISDIPLDNLIAPGVVVDISDKTSRYSDYTLTIDDLQTWEASHGQIPDGSVLLVATGWDRYWNEPVEYLGSLEKDIRKLHFPGVSPEAAQWLVDNRKIVGIGIDSVSLESPRVTDFRAHTILSANKVFNLENLRGLTSLPPTGFTVFALPMKLDGASGAPARVMAIVDDDSDHHSCACFISVAWSVTSLFLVCIWTM